MKTINCEQHKTSNRSGQTEKCQCKYVNRNWARDLKLYKQFMKTLGKK